jgi:hypothetical protein
VGRRMEIKFVRNVVPMGLILVVMLLGDRPWSYSSNRVWAQNSNSPSSTATTPAVSESKNPTLDPSSIKNSDPSSKPILDAGKPLEEINKSVIPIWLWLILGGLGLWNIALSFLFWQSIKEANLIGRKTDQNLNKLKDNDEKLNQRISRKFDELKNQFSAYERNLEMVKLQAQPKPARFDNYSVQPPSKPENYGFDEPFVSQDYKYTARSSNYSQPAPISSEPWDNIVQNYNLSPQVLESSIVERVSESEESVASRRGNSNTTVFLKSTNNYSYWIFAGEDRNYWLTPKSDLKITPMGFDTLQALFECPEYQQGSRIQMIKPAKVAQNSSSGGWDLLEKGQVQFTR